MTKTKPMLSSKAVHHAEKTIRAGAEDQERFAVEYEEVSVFGTNKEGEIEVQTEQGIWFPKGSKKFRWSSVKGWYYLSRGLGSTIVL